MLRVNRSHNACNYEEVTAGRQRGVREERIKLIP